MGIILSRKKHFYTRVPIIIVLIGLFSISPVLISVAGAWITELTTNQPCSEANCFWGGLGWMFLMTIPLGIGIAIIFILILIYDLTRLKKDYSGKKQEE